LAFQKGSAKGNRQAAGSLGRQDAEQRAPCRHPAKLPLQDTNHETVFVQITHGDGKERTICGEIGAEQYGAGRDARYLQDVLEKARRHVHHGDRVAHEWQRREQAPEALGVTGYRKVARPAPRGRSQLRQVHGQPLLQLAGAARSDQGRPRQTTADVDQQAGPVRLRPRAGERRGSRPRSIRAANRRDENRPPVHRSAGLA
jgi:hypothetical protein